MCVNHAFTLVVHAVSCFSTSALLHTDAAGGIGNTIRYACVFLCVDQNVDLWT